MRSLYFLEAVVLIDVVHLGALLDEPSKPIRLEIILHAATRPLLLANQRVVIVAVVPVILPLDHVAAAGASLCYIAGHRQSLLRQLMERFCVRHRD